MDILVEVLVTILPTLLLAVSLGVLLWAMIDISKRQYVDSRLWWAFLIVFVPILGPMAYLINSRRAK